jgi:hypothetical protein
MSHALQVELMLTQTGIEQATINKTCVMYHLLLSATTHDVSALRRFEQEAHIAMIPFSPISFRYSTSQLRCLTIFSLLLFSLLF